MDLSRIFHPTDFSDSAARALQLAADLAAAHDATLYLFHAETLHGEGLDHALGNLDSAAATARERVGHLRPGDTPKVEVIAGRAVLPFEAIMRAADEPRARASAGRSPTIDWPSLATDWRQRRTVRQGRKRRPTRNAHPNRVSDTASAVWHPRTQTPRTSQIRAARGWLPRRASLALERALASSNAEIVADAHRQPVRQQVRHADDDDRSGRQRPAGDAGHDRKRRKNAVVRPVDEVSHVVLRCLVEPVRLHVIRRSGPSGSTYMIPHRPSPTIIIGYGRRTSAAERGELPDNGKAHYIW